MSLNSAVSRARPNLAGQLFAKSQKVSEGLGMMDKSSVTSSTGDPLNEAGAFRSLQGAVKSKIDQAIQEASFVDSNLQVGNVGVRAPDGPVGQSPSEIGRVFDWGKSFERWLRSSIETVSFTKEYYGAVMALFNLYAMDKLDDRVLESLNDEDLSEIQSIVREFKTSIDVI